MSYTEAPVRFDRLTEIEAGRPIFIPGMPGSGLVAAIVVDLLTRQLSLSHHGTVHANSLPPVASYKDGRIRDLVRVYAGTNPDVMTLVSDIAPPPYAYPALSQVALTELAPEFERAILIAGAPVEDETQVGEVVGVATTDAMRTDLDTAGIALAGGNGLIGGVTGALMSDCYHAGVPAIGLIVGCNPYVPDPRAAKGVVEDALEPLVGFDIDTTELDEEAEEIEAQLQQLADHFQQTQAAQQAPPGDDDQRAFPSMYQ